ncbi:MAG: hypothetical protein ACFBRM_10015 [Pikeienuella sp.]
MPKPATLTLSAIALALTGCALSPERSGLDRVSESDALAGGVFRPGGATLTLTAGLREQAGRLAICGAWAGHGPRAQQHARDVLGAGIVFAGGQRLQQNLTFLAEDRAGGLTPGTAAGCTLTAEPWRGSVPVEIRLPRMVVERDCDDYGGCDVTTFRQVPLARGP